MGRQMRIETIFKIQPDQIIAFLLIVDFATIEGRILVLGNNTANEASDYPVVDGTINDGAFHVGGDIPADRAEYIGRIAVMCDANFKITLGRIGVLHASLGRRG